MSGPSHGQTSRSSTSSPPSDISSATLHSERALGLIEKGEPSTLKKRMSSTSDHEDLIVEAGTKRAASDIGEPLGGLAAREDDYGFKKHRSRNSGGFLLGSAFTPPGQSAIRAEGDNREQKDGKGKRRSQGASQNVEKKRSTHHRHRPKSSLGSSPLSNMVTNTPPFEEDAHEQETGESSHRSLSNGNDLANLTVSQDAIRDQGTRWSNNHAQPFQPPASSIGLDTDPVEIVNLALNLSESRRRKRSVGGIIAQNAAGNRRVVSMNQPSPASYDNIPPVVAGSSLRQHLQQQRRTSRNVSPLPEKGNRVSTASPRPSSCYAAEPGPNSTVFPPADLDLGPDIPYKFSDATLSRAEKARNSMELFYEYRRLLPCLSPLESTQAMSLNNPAAVRSNSTERDSSTGLRRYGRAYNPLQYIRNRKCRARERMALDAEGAGWNNVEAVRAWVDKVVGHSGQNPIASGDIAALPAPLVDPQNPPDAGKSPSSSVHHNNGNKATKPRRPRLDWLMTPADLLADAFWLEQGTNKLLVEDRNGNRKFPLHRSPGLSKPAANEAHAQANSQPFTQPDGRVKAAGDPEGTPDNSIAPALDAESVERGRRRHQPHTSVHDLQGDTISSGGTHQWQKSHARSRSPSSPSMHDERRLEQQRERSRDEGRDREDASHQALEKTMITMSQQGANEGIEAGHGSGDSSQSEHSRQINGGYRNDQTDLPKHQKFHRRPHPINVSRERATSSPRASVDSDRGRHLRSLNDELDTTAPSSPTVHGFVPSIAINLSPPPSRSPSPMKKTLTSKLNLLRPDRSKERQAMEDIDYATEDDLSRKSSRQTGAELEAQASGGTGRGGLTSPTKKLFSRRLDENLGKESRRSGSRSIKGDKDMKESESRLRGILKGGRIAELVGNEVSRVGDFIWKRDGPTNHSLQTSSASSIASDSSDSDGLEPLSAGSETKAIQKLSRTSTRSNDGKDSNRAVPELDQPKYHMSNLPTFQSPFRENQQRPKSGLTSSVDDPITRQQAARRDRGRPTRFESLAPPRIDVRGGPKDDVGSPRTRTTDEAGVDLHRNDSPLDRQRPGSVPSERGDYGNDKNLSAFLGPPGSTRRFGPPVTGLTGLSVSHAPDSDRPREEGQTQWSISSHEMSAIHRPATKREIAHLRALLLSSGIKAKEICRRANEVRDPGPTFLSKISENPIPRVPRSQEHVLAARILIKNIELTHRTLVDAKERFSSRTIARLHGQIKSVENRIQYKLTPLLRACADDAEAFGVELTTTQTLMVKQLNDNVTHIMRRRRRRLKWIRRTGYVFLEWTLLGVMWWVWLVVVIVRLLRGGLGGILRGVRWIFWL